MSFVVVDYRVGQNHVHYALGPRAPVLDVIVSG